MTPLAPCHGHKLNRHQVKYSRYCSSTRASQVQINQNAAGGRVGAHDDWEEIRLKVQEREGRLRESRIQYSTASQAHFGGDWVPQGSGSNCLFAYELGARGVVER